MKVNIFIGRSKVCKRRCMAHLIRKFWTSIDQLTKSSVSFSLSLSTESELAILSELYTYVGKRKSEILSSINWEITRSFICQSQSEKKLVSFQSSCKGMQYIPAGASRIIHSYLFKILLTHDEGSRIGRSIRNSNPVMTSSAGVYLFIYLFIGSYYGYTLYKNSWPLMRGHA